MNLTQAMEGKEYIIKAIETDDEELNSFLFSLGCYSGEPITVVKSKKKNLVVSIKDARYNIDNLLAEVIEVY
ncbi:MAG: ferrous iron transport protein A [Clostridia bacterium]|nr:ferrous iron transport protein A [Clostridia bacterium]